MSSQNDLRCMWIGGNHPRHLYYINAVHRVFPFVAGVQEYREHMIPEAPTGISAADTRHFRRHFQKRAEAEEKYFGQQSSPDCEMLQVSEDSLSDAEVASFVQRMDPDVVLVFGCGMIKDPLYSSLPVKTLNLHLGLSPRYRGAATLFWPFYFLEPTYAGTTFHHLVGEPDAGDVVHQVVPELQKDDGIHDVACKCVVDSSRAAVQLIHSVRDQGDWSRFRQRATGKNFLSRDFRPEHLRIIYELYDDDIVRACLDGHLSPPKPRLVQQPSMETR